MAVAVEPSASVVFSNEKSPLIVWPRMASDSPTPSARRYGPAGRLSVMVEPPTVRVRLTAAACVLSETPIVPPKATPGIETETVPEMRPAMPEPPATSTPDPFVTVSEPSETVMFVAATVTSPLGACSKAKSPVSDWPASASCAPVAWNDRSLIARLTTTSEEPGIESVWLIARPVVLTRTVAVPVIVTPLMPTSETVPVATSA